MEDFEGDDFKGDKGSPQFYEWFLAASAVFFGILVLVLMTSVRSADAAERCEAPPVERVAQVGHFQWVDQRMELKVLRASSAAEPAAQIWVGNQCAAVCHLKKRSAKKALNLECKTPSFESLVSPELTMWGEMPKSATLHFSSWLKGYRNVSIKLARSQ